MSEEAEKHMRAEHQRIEKFFEERKREAKNQLISSIAQLNLSKKKEEAENLLTEIERMNLDFGHENISSVEQDFQLACNLVLRAEKVRKAQVLESDIDFSEAVVHLEHFQEKIMSRFLSFKFLPK